MSLVVEQSVTGLHNIAFGHQQLGYDALECKGRNSVALTHRELQNTLLSLT